MTKINLRLIPIINMKKIILILGLMLFLSSCTKEKKDGGLYYWNIFIIDSKEEMVPAHEYTLNIPAEAGTYDLRTIFSLSQKGRGMFCYFLVGDSEYYKSSVIGTPVAYPKDTKYVMQTVQIQAAENSTGKERKCIFGLRPDSPEPYAADIIVIQSSK
jgi:hypothetical protein